MLLEIWTQRKNSLFFVCDSKKKKFITIAKKKLVWIVEHGVKENDQKSKDRSSRRITTIARNFKEYRKKSEQLLVAAVTFWFVLIDNFFVSLAC